MDYIETPEIINLPSKLMPAITGFNNHRYFLLEGGRGSGKTQSVARLLLYIAELRKVRVFCGREIQGTIEDSVYTVLKDLIDEYNLAYSITLKEIKHLHSGSTFRFRGFREQGNVNVKGLEAVDILWVEEAQSITKRTLDIILPTIRDKAGKTTKIFFTMNRYLREDAVPAALLSHPECLHININYYDNPHCPKNLIDQANDMKLKSERDYNHIWLGHPLPSADDYLFNFDKLYAANKIKPFGDNFVGFRSVGIDFAAQGADQCCATIIDRKSNQHWEIADIIPWDYSDTTESIGKIINIIGSARPDVAMFDIGGMGKPVYDQLIKSNIKIEAFDGATTNGVDTLRHANKRALGYFTLKEWFDCGYLCVDSEYKELMAQLEKVRFKYRQNGSCIIQPKLEMKKDLGYSPDIADSFMMAVYGAFTFNRLAVNKMEWSSPSKIKRVTGGRWGKRR